MRTRRLLSFAALLGAAALWTGTAQGAVNCSVTPAGFSLVYDPTLATDTLGSSSVTMFCTRAATDPAQFTYSLDQNGGATGANRATLGANRVSYRLYQDSAYVTRWRANNVAPIQGSINFGTGTAVSVTVPYYILIPRGQGRPAGGYSDTLLVTMTYNGGQITTGTFTGVILINASCQLSTPPGNISFAYTSFQTAAATATTPLAVLCTNGVPYTLSLDTTTGTLLGLGYTLSLNPGTAATGTGLAQNFTVNGTIAANQAGTCATGTCAATNVHTLTITY